MVLLGCLLVGASAGAETTSWPPIADLQSLLRSQVPDLPPTTSGETNAGAYLNSLAPWVLVGEETPTSAGHALSRTNVYGEGIGYLRVREVQNGLAEAMVGALSSLGGTDRLHGVIVDLRFAGGADFREATSAAGVLASQEPRGFRLGAAELETRAVTTSHRLPTVILVNRQTRGAAEALAAAARHLNAPSLVIGTNTSGQARAYRPVSVPGGSVVRVAGDAFALPGGTTIPLTGLAPDVQVAVSDEDEAIHFNDEFRRVSKGKTVTAEPSFRLNEAELVRRRRGPRSAGERAAGTPARVLQDPVLARGVDLLESLGSQGADAGNSR
jgi:hypothetical protein